MRWLVMYNYYNSHTEEVEEATEIGQCRLEMAMKKQMFEAYHHLK